jgi:hypothetical protein
VALILKLAISPPVELIVKPVAVVLTVLLSEDAERVNAGAASAAVDATSQTFTGNGSQTNFTLSTSVVQQKNVIVTINGILQIPTTHYTISGTTLAFTSAPYNTAVIEARSMEGVVVAGLTGATGPAGPTGPAGSSGDPFPGLLLLGGM